MWDQNNDTEEPKTQEWKKKKMMKDRKVAGLKGESLKVQDQ